MADVIATKTFTHGGVQVRKGDIYASTHELPTLYPGNFSATMGGASVAAGTLGTVIGSIAWTEGGTVSGYVPLYGTITP